MKLASLTVATALAGAAFAVHAQTPPPPPAPPGDAKAIVVKAADTKLLDVATWMDGDKVMVARGEDAAKAPKSATQFHVRPLALGPGASYREVHVTKGSTLVTPKGGDQMVYVVKGRMEVTLGGVKSEVQPGDAFRKVGAQLNTYKAIDEAVFLETEAPAAMPAMPGMPPGPPGAAMPGAKPGAMPPPAPGGMPPH